MSTAEENSRYRYLFTAHIPKPPFPPHLAWRPGRPWICPRPLRDLQTYYPDHLWITADSPPEKLPLAWQIGIHRDGIGIGDIAIWNRLYPFWPWAFRDQRQYLHSPAFGANSFVTAALQIWVKRLAARRPVGRLSLATRKERSRCPYLAATHTVEIWATTFERGLTFLPPCACGHPTGNFCDLCARAICTDCENADDTCLCTAVVL